MSVPICSNLKGARPLFENGQPSELTKKALEFCQAYQAQQNTTRQFVDALNKQGLLVPRVAKVTLANGTERTLQGFRIVDEQKFDKLSDEVFLDWRKKGWLGLIYVHMISQSGWTALVERVNRRTAAGG